MSPLLPFFIKPLSFRENIFAGFELVILIASSKLQFVKSMTTSTHFEIGDAAPANAFIPGNLTTLGVSNSFLSPRIYSPGGNPAKSNASDTKIVCWEKKPNYLNRNEHDSLRPHVILILTTRSTYLQLSNFVTAPNSIKLDFH